MKACALTSREARHRELLDHHRFGLGHITGTGLLNQTDLLSESTSIRPLLQPEGLQIELIAGIGAVFLLLIVLSGVVCYCCRRRGEQKPAPPLPAP